MRAKAAYENSYACLLDLVLEDDFVDASRSPIAEEAKGRGRKQRRRKSTIGAGIVDDEEPKPPTTSTSSPPFPPAPARPRPRRDRYSLVEVDDEDLPEVLKFNRFIQTGYRPAPMTRSECLCSVVPFLSRRPSKAGERPPLLHNETFNVVTHLVPLLLVVLFLSSGLSDGHWPGEGGDWALFFHLLPVALCLAGSVCYHSLMPDAANYRFYLSVDVCGILALAVDGTRAMSARPVSCVDVGGSSGLVPAALGLLRAALAALPLSPVPSSSSSPDPSPLSVPSLSRAALARDAALASYAALVALAAYKALRGKTAAQRGWPLLALLLVRLGVLSARAVEVWGLGDGDGGQPPTHASSLRASLRLYALAELASFLGGSVNVLRVPERFVKRLPPLEREGGAESESDGNGERRERSRPRRRLVDFAFNSHNLMHLLSLVALWFYHGAATEDRRHWVEHGCGVRSR